MRRVLFPSLVLASIAAAISADPIQLRLRGDSLFASAPRLDLLQPKLLARLKGGGTVAYDFQLSLWVGTRNTARRRSFERFVVSYDLWEEKFAVTNLRKPRTAVAGLASNGIAAWCLDNISLGAAGVGPQEQIWVGLDVRSVDQRHEIEEAEREGFNLNSLIEMLSRPARSGESRWSLQTGPVRLADLRAGARQFAEAERMGE
jgi:hypothetical protein